MKRILYLVPLLLLTGCMSDEVSQSGSAVVNCSGGLINICSASQVNSFAPTADEALFGALCALGMLIAIGAAMLVFRKPE